MTVIINFNVTCVPVAQPRQRHRVMTAGGRTFAQNFTPAKHPVQAFKAAVQLAAKNALDAQCPSSAPLDGALNLSVVFLLPRPKSMVWKKRPMPRWWHTTRPDADNLLKSVKDALNGLCWRDDSQVSVVKVTKLYASGEETPGAEVTISELS